MENFRFVDIFATKGVEYLVVIGFLLSLIPFWLLISKQAKITKQLQNVLGILSAKILRIPQGLFFSRNHTWAHMEKSGVANVGLDDLLQHLTGEVKFYSLREPGDDIKKGDIMAEIKSNDKLLKIFSPISGKILKANAVLEDEPGIINEDPYGRGWLYKIKPTNWISDTYTCYFAEDATNFANSELERLKDFLVISNKKHSLEPAGVVLQEGGEIRDNVLTELPDGVWQDFQKEFLNRV